VSSGLRDRIGVIFHPFYLLTDDIYVKSLLSSEEKNPIEEYLVARCSLNRPGNSIQERDHY